MSFTLGRGIGYVFYIGTGHRLCLLHWDGAQAMSFTLGRGIGYVFYIGTGHRLCLLHWDRA